jgi:hypothetical protein
MVGRYEQIGGRRTYIPPFVNERFDGPPYWSCTFTALLNGANVAWLGQKPATHAEVAALARASGDTEPRSGSRARHMIEAVRVRYRERVAIDNVPARKARDRLGDGYALVAGVTFGELPPKYRRWSPHFKLGHRVTVLGFSQDRIRLLDPLANKDASYGGIWIPWAVFEKAWWPEEQLWFKEGQFVAGGEPAPKRSDTTPPANPSPANVAPTVASAATGPRILRRFRPARHFRVAAHTTVIAYAPGNPPVVARRLTFPHASGAMFDALVTFDPKVAAMGDPGRTFLRITKGAFARRFIETGARGITANIAPDFVATTTTEAVSAPPAAATDIDKAVLEARRAEWDRIALAVAGRIVLPDRP